jgi:hypothetical protein
VKTAPRSSLAAASLAEVPELHGFIQANPGFDVLGADLLDRARLDALNWEGTEREKAVGLLRRWQRVLRIEPELHNARLLIGRGFESAHRIVSLARGEFVRKLGPELDGGAEKAGRIYDTAATVRSRASHLAANVHALVASPHFRAMNVNHVADDLPTYFEGLASYAEIFGSLDYCECEECGSVLGPAAYLVDLLRIVDRAITEPNKDILKGLKFDDRRPDIAAIPLTCANTNDEVPYLEIVNGALEQTVAAELGVTGSDAVYQELAQMFHPFELPFNLPLTRIRRYLGSRDLKLADVYAAFASGPGPAPEQVREILGLTAEQLDYLAPPDSGGLLASIEAGYGLAEKDLAGLTRLDRFMERTGLGMTEVGDLLLQGLGPQEILDTTGTYAIAGGKEGPLILTQEGASVTGTMAGRGSLRGNLDGATVRGTWTAAGAAEPAGSFALEFDPSGTPCKGEWATWADSKAGGQWQGARVPEADAPATGGLIPHSLFVNRTLGSRQYLRLVEKSVGSGEFETDIEGQWNGTLDALNRFVRLARSLGWSWAELDWTLTTLRPPSVDGEGDITSGAELDEATLTKLAKVVELVEAHGLPLPVATALWFDLKTTGRGEEEESAAPFDQLFNAAGVLSSSPGRGVYRPRIEPGPTSFPNPLYRDAPQKWRVGGGTVKHGGPGEPIVAAIPGDPAALQVIAAALFGPGAKIELTVPRLSALYRHLALAEHLGLAADAYLKLYELRGLAKPGALPMVVSPAKALGLVETAAWIAASGLRVEDVLYVITGLADSSVTTGYDPSTLPAFLRALAEGMKPVLVSAATFQSPLVSGAVPAAIAQALVNQGFVDPAGVVVGDPLKKPDLRSIGEYAPAAAALTPAQVEDALTRLAAARTAQQSHLAGLVAPLLKIAPDAASTLVEGTAGWLGVANVVAPFLSTPLFTVEAQSVFAAGVPDPQLVMGAFAAAGQPLGGRPAIEPLVVTTWGVTAIEAAGTDPEVERRAFQATTADGTAVSFFAAAATPGEPAKPREPATPLFAVPGEEVLKDGELEPSLVAKALSSRQPAHPLTEVEVAQGVRPRAWSVTDPVSGTRYGATQLGGPGTDVSFSAPSGAAKTTPELVAEFVAALSRAALLMNGTGLSTTAMAALFAAPAAFAVEQDTPQKPLPLSLESVRHAHVYGQLKTAFGDSADSLGKYLASADHEIDELCAVTRWDPVAAGYLCDRLFKKGGKCATVERVSRLARVFSIAASLGVDVYAVEALDAARGMAATGEDWSTASTLADGLLQARAAATPAQRWPATLLALDAPLLAARRDALVAVALWKLGQRFTDITTPRNLYEYLLLDVEMAGCAQVSPIREALNATQLYLQRCRLNLEREVAIDPQNLPDVWWEWLLDYRVWEANREVFLYPENYIDPALRSTRTLPFQELQNGLLQGPVTDEAVSEAFHKYLDAFKEIAGLVPVGSCHAEVHGVDTMFVLSRTAAQPYKFYVASRERVAEDPSSFAWSEWLPLEISINSPNVTPVYAFGKLHVLWVELTEKTEADGSKNPTGRCPITEATVKLSFRNPSGKWIQPQTVVADQVVNVEAPQIHGPFAEIYKDTDALWWNKVAAVFVPAGSGGLSGGDRLCVYYGPLMSPQVGSAAPAALKEPEPNPKAIEFFEAIEEKQEVMPDFEKAMPDSGWGYRIPMNPVLVLDANLDPMSLSGDGEYLCLGSNGSAEPEVVIPPPTFRPALSGSEVLLVYDARTIFNEYVGGSSVVGIEVPPPSQPLDGESFVSDFISKSRSEDWFTALVGAEVIDQTGHLMGEPLTASSMFSVLLKPPSSGKEARAVSEALLTALSGTPRLFTNVSTQAAALVPDGNQPGAFLLVNGSEAFSVEASKSEARFAPTSSVLDVVTWDKAIAARAFVSRDIDLRQSRAFYKQLSETSHGQSGDTYISHGTVQLPAGTTAKGIAEILGTDFGRAQQVLKVLESPTPGPTFLAYLGPPLLIGEAAVESLDFSVTRLSTSAVPALERALSAGGIDALFALERQQLPLEPELPFSRLRPSAEPRVVPPVTAYGDQVEFDGPFGLYYWELFFHAPFLVANMLRDNQQFQAAERWFQYVFDPTRPPEPLTEANFESSLPAGVDRKNAKAIYAAFVGKGWLAADGAVTPSGSAVSVEEIEKATTSDLVNQAEATALRSLLANRYLAKPTTGRYWRFAPFRNQTLESLKEELGNAAEIRAYNDEPFDPHAIARLRIGAYEKSVVMAYIGNLLDWGDREFTRYTWESVTSARMLYSYAFDLLGARPVDLGKCEEQPPVTFAEVRARYASEAGGIPQFLIDMENALPGGQPGGPVLEGAEKGFNDLGTTFTVPENEQLLGLWDRVEDRLYKIRNCMNIAGQFEPLALWDPPINPADLVRAAAGGDFSGLQQQLQQSVPSYRFALTIERAEELAETVRSFGSALLAALERRDAEGLALVRAAQELGVLNMVTATKQSAIEGLEGQLAGLQEGLASAQYRAGYYAQLIATGLNSSELANLALGNAAVEAHAAALPFYGMSIGGFLIPNIFGFSDGGMSFGEAINASASIASTVAEMSAGEANVAQTTAQNERRAEEWALQKQTAEYELSQLTEQIAAAEVAITAAKQDLAINAREIDNATKVESLLRTNFTNQDLYAWMTGRIATVYFQAFRLAQDMALAAQTAYRFELGSEDTFIAFGNWDDLHQGLLAGEGLLLSLKQMKKAYFDADTRRLEIEKTVSLRQAFPAAFAGFRWGHSEGGEGAPGRLDFTLSEQLFDFDYPGHYDRKIKSITVSLPSVVGPYQDFHVTLTQNGNLVVLDPDAEAVEAAIAATTANHGNDKPTAPAGTMRENWAPNQSIAVSRGVDDSGLFVLDFRDERYLPFEGTGAVSSWTLSMPPETNRIDFDNVSDVILKVRYTARDGGAEFASKVKRLYSQGDKDPYLNAIAYNLASAFSAQWRTLVDPAAKPPSKMSFPVAASAVLPNLTGRLFAVVVQLQLADGATVSSSGESFLSLGVAGKPGTPIPILNGYGEMTPEMIQKAGMESSFAGTEWTLELDKPPFDIAKLEDVAIAFVYSANPFAQVPGGGAEVATPDV